MGVFSSNAATYTFDSIDFPIFVAPYGSIGGTWNLNDRGYSSSAEDVISAEAFFTLSDASNFGNETAVVSLDGVDIASANNFVGVMLGGLVSVTIAQDGIVNWLVKETSGLFGFAITDATFTVETATRTQRVPDGGSMMTLLGLSVLGLGWVGRRVRA